MLLDNQEVNKDLAPSLSQSESKVIITTAGKAAVIYLDSKGKDYDCKCRRN